MKNQITKGEWAVRSVEKVDEDTRQIYFSANGMDPGKDPYFLHYYRINFDGTGLTPLTAADADHTRDVLARQHVSTWTPTRASISPPVSELRRTGDRMRWC